MRWRTTDRRASQVDAAKSAVAAAQGQLGVSRAENLQGQQHGAVCHHHRSL